MENSAKYPSIVVMGGGTGNFTMLQDLKHVTPNLTAIVNASDDGGSTGRLRDEFGVLPPGDVRQCLVALSEAPEMRDVFDIRFGKGNGHGELSGHSVGNIILAALSQEYGNFSEAIRVASHVLRITGTVLPVVLENHVLVMDDGDNIVVGESNIDHYRIQSPEPKVRLKPEATANPEALQAIDKADIVLISPGNTYCSILPVLSIKGIREALQATNARKVAVSNLMTKPGHTDGWHVADYLREYHYYIGADCLDFVIYNNLPPTSDLMAKYAAEGEMPVRSDSEGFRGMTERFIGGSLVAYDLIRQYPRDMKKHRTLIRHNAKLVAKVLMNLDKEFPR